MCPAVLRKTDRPKLAGVSWFLDKLQILALLSIELINIYDLSIIKIIEMYAFSIVENII